MASEEAVPEKKTRNVRLRLRLRNPVSMAGIALAIVSAANIFLFSD